MGVLTGAFVTCDRCGEQLFIEQDRAPIALIPNHWSEKDGVVLCSHCEEEKRKVLQKFMQNCENCTYYRNQHDDKPCKDCSIWDDFNTASMWQPAFSDGAIWRPSS